MKKRMLSFLLALVMVMTLVPVMETEVKAASNIVINGVDIGYANGSYFTKNGSSCKDYNNYNINGVATDRCHNRSGYDCTRTTDPSCNCMRYWPTGSASTCEIDLKASQCFGFTRYCQWKVYGTYDMNSPSSFTDITGDIYESGCTGSNLKSKLKNCAPATHIRTFEWKKGWGHSICIVSTSDYGVDFVDCNYDGCCIVRAKTMSWDELAEYMKGYGGIDYANAYNGKVPSAPSVSTKSFIEAYPLSYGNIPVYASPNGEQLSNRYITGSTDVCKIFEISGEWFHVSYPSTAEADGWFEAWVPADEFSKRDYGHNMTTEKSYTLYRRSDKKEFFATVPAGVELVGLSIEGSMKQVAYKVSGNTNRMGWIEVHTHNYSASVKSPTCTAKGYTTYTCACGNSYKDHYTEATGHKPKTIEGKAATCTESGLTDGSKCSKCGLIITDLKKIEALGHDWDSGTVTKAATCEKNGVKTYTCRNNKNHTKTESIPAKGHAYNAKVYTKATCTEKGYSTYQCVVIGCDSEYMDDYVEPLGHKWNSGKVTKNATCEAAGEKKFTCQNDSSHTKTETIKATGHKDNDDNYKCDTCGKNLCNDHTSVVIKGKAATCTEAGLTDGFKCSKCSKVLEKQKEIPATGHDTELRNAKSSTCTTGGYTGDEVCKTCGKTIKPGVGSAATGHTLDVKFSDKGEEVIYCSVCSEVLKINQPICSKGHTPGSAVKENATAATCEKAGSYDEVVYCTECKAEISRTNKTLSALGHNWDGGKVTTAATCEKNGIKTYTCRNDQSHVKKGAIKATGHSFSAGKCTVCGAFDPNYTTPDPTPANPFKDIKKSDWFYNAVLWAVGQGFTGGTSATTFSPNNLCTREQVVTFLWASAGKPEPESTYNPFIDVRQSDWFYEAVMWAVENGITGGITATQFGTGQTCTRAQVAAFLYAYKGKPAFTSAQSPFSDVSSRDWFYKAVMWAVENDITGGVGNGLFGHGQPCTRGQIALFLYKSDPIEGTPQKPDKETADSNKAAYAAYIPVVEQAIAEEVVRPQSEGMLYDMDQDGIQELIMIHEESVMEDDVCIDVKTVCSVYDVENGRIIVKLNKVYLNSSAGAPESYVGMVEYQGDTLFLLHSTNAGDMSAYTSNILLDPITFGQVLNQETDEYGSEIDGVRYIDMIDDGHGSMSEFMKSGMSLSKLLTHLKKNQ